VTPWVLDTTAGVLAARFLCSNHVGWAVSFDPQVLVLKDSYVTVLCYSRC
jgi:hypothetical protein